jgi:hypothetical protein
MLRVSEESEAHFLIRKGLGCVVAVGFALALNVSQGNVIISLGRVSQGVVKGL